MRQLGHVEKKQNRLTKIILLTFFLTIGLFAILKIFHLDKIAFRAPKTVVQLITDQGLKNDHGRTNVLLLGIGGDGHDGPDLTDTIILASIDKNGKDIVLISIPRDLWNDETKSKINAVYAYGQEKDGTGLAKAENSISGLLGIPIHYGFRIDFSGFEKAVDEVNGLDITIDNTFTDPKYPITGKEDDLCGLTIEDQDKDGQKIQVVKDATGSAIPLTEINDQNDPFTCRYESLTFKKGPTHMDGQTALKYVRSRHGNNNEGTDFARSARQQKVIEAFRDKVLSKKTLLDPKTLATLAQTFGKSIDTDIGHDETPLFSKLALKADKSNIRRIVLDSDKDNSLLAVGDPASSYGGQFVLVPKTNWTDISEFLQGELYKDTAEK